MTFQKNHILLLFVVVCLATSKKCQGETRTFDVVIYGGTSAGVSAAIQVTRLGKSVAIIEPGKHLGGLTSGGLGATDIGNKAAIGGVSREFYRRVKQHYKNDAAWIWQRRDQFKSSRSDGRGNDAMWTFEPRVAEKIMNDFVRQSNASLFLATKLDRKRGVRKQGRTIQTLRTLNGDVFRAKRFIDATYEGDLFAAAGVSFIVGREANSRYNETLNGVQTKNAVKHQLQPNVDPYIVKGDPTSGLLPGIDPDGPGKEGGRDDRVQAYCFRMCNTTHEPNRLPFLKPADYNELEHELLLRNFEAGAKIAPWHPIDMPNRKTDTNNNGGVSTDYIGFNEAWAEASYHERERIFRDHLRYQKGLLWTLANHPRVPKNIRVEFSRWGSCKDEFPDFAGWPHQLYVREGRRMISDYVMTQYHCEGKTAALDSVGLAAYTMDSHNVQRYVDDKGHARNEGDVQVGGFPPYPISYRSIVPRESECDNLLVPVSLSASHIAYGSIRMEPVFMVLGQSAATAACQSIDQQVSVQRLDYRDLRKRLLDDKQVLSWPVK